MNGFIRGIVTGTVAAASKLLRLDVSGRSDETIEDREALQQYGLQSRPPDGAEAVLIRQGNHILIVASDDRRYRIALSKGEVSLSTDEGDVIHLKRNHEIDITAGTGGKVNVSAGSEVNVSAPTVRLGGLALATALGIVTGACSCAITGAPHPVTSQTVKATL